MFAALATLTQMAYDSLRAVGLYLATRLFLVAILTIVLPYVLQGFFYYCFDAVLAFGSFAYDLFVPAVADNIASAGLDFNQNFSLPGLGGFLATQTGLIDYFSVIITGWGICWVISFSKRAVTW